MKEVTGDLIQLVKKGKFDTSETILKNEEQDGQRLVKNFVEILRSLRPAVSLPAALLVHIGAKLSGQKTDWMIVFVMFITTGLIMLQNDYFDRLQDSVQKNKRFVFDNETLVSGVLICGWLSVLTFICFFEVRVQVLLLLIAIIGFTYSFLRGVVMIPLFAVALLSASPLLLQGNLSNTIILLFVAIFLAITGREILKDMEDTAADIGYKKTLFTEKILSTKQANIVVAALFSFSLAALVLIAQYFSLTRQIFSSIPAIFVALSISTLLSTKASTTQSKKLFDYGMISLVLMLSF